MQNSPWRPRWLEGPERFRPVLGRQDTRHLRMHGLGFSVQGLGFGIWGVGFRVWSLGFWVWGLGFGIYRVWGLGFRV